ncbi:hypothetical protein AB205_0062370, partial [Aquarana catesbeiana]
EEYHLHSVYKSKILEFPLDELPSEFWSLNETIVKLPQTRRSRRKKRQTQPLSGSVMDETKYVELMIVNDHLMYKKHRLSVGQTNNYAKSVVNFADMVSAIKKNLFKTCLQKTYFCVINTYSKSSASFCFCWATCRCDL